MFNAGRYRERAERGELKTVVKRSYPAPAVANQVPGTTVQLTYYATTEGVTIALVHQYVRPDGTLGGSGKPDPKWLLREREALIPSHGDDETCPECAG